MKIGDKVQIINVGEMFLCYNKWFDDKDPQLKKMFTNKNIDDDYVNDTFTIVAKGPRGHEIQETLCAILHPQLKKVYLISEKGLKKIEEDMKFERGDRVKVIDSNGVYAYYDDWFKKNAPELGFKYAYSVKKIPLDHEYVIIKSGSTEFTDENVYAISENTLTLSPVYLVDESCLKISKNSFEIGDTVHMKNKLYMYITYPDWFKKYNSDLGIKYAYGTKLQFISKNCEYEIVEKGKHLTCDIMLYAIQEKGNELAQVYLIAERGLEPVN